MAHFTSLTQPLATVSETAPAGFEPSIALVLGRACRLSYLQYASNLPEMSAELIQEAMGTGGTFSQVGCGFTTSEPIGSGSTVGEPGDYRDVPIGFALHCAPAGGGAFNVIALRGTRSYREWLDDANVLPAYWHVGDNNGQYYDELTVKGLGMVHGGFYELYNVGTNGIEPKKTDHGLLKYSYSRPSGSIASAVEAVWGKLDTSLPLYVTGHSLGAGLAVICAMDVAVNFPESHKNAQLHMWNLAGPLVAAGVGFEDHSIGASVFVQSYSARVHSSFRIVNATDIVAITPPTQLGTQSVRLEYAHVTDNTVEYCNQAGSIGGNHSLVDNYLPYLESLSRGFV